MKRVKRAIFALLVLLRSTAGWNASSSVPAGRAVSWKLSWHFPSEQKFSTAFSKLYTVTKYFREFHFHNTRNKLLITFRTSLLKKHDTINFRINARTGNCVKSYSKNHCQKLFYEDFVDHSGGFRFKLFQNFIVKVGNICQLGRIVYFQQ